MMKLTKRQKLTISDMYRLGTMKNRIDERTYYNIWNAFAKEVMINHIIGSGNTFKVPKGLGEIAVYKRPTKRKKMVDFKKTKDYGYTIYHNNYHTDSMHVYFDWKSYIKNERLFRFKATRFNSRLLAKGIIENNAINTYFEKE